MTSNHTDLKQKLYDDLQRLLWAMTWDLANDNRWQLEPDEIFAELCLELVKTAEKYVDKPYTEIKALVVVCCRHRVYDLATMNYSTHRKAEATALSLDDDELNLDVGVEVEYFDATAFMSKLSPDAKRLVAEILHPSERTQQLYELSCLRRKSTSKGDWSIGINPGLMQRALGWPQYRLNAAWNEVTQALQAASAV